MAGRHVAGEREEGDAGTVFHLLVAGEHARRAAPDDRAGAAGGAHGARHAREAGSMRRRRKHEHRVRQR